ncbi:hypothetical protein B0T10DRAFT_233545 [Thelonectria olida]|uniref:C2H2-type domain-containing protein n=1 Tax=Thelonectria olida TaxID=1576542 RepID=A0A9P8VV18_9HYPO|nr:hypothetical protein B0T10DRAFT_233545 [Thelonectria olida]
MELTPQNFAGARSGQRDTYTMKRSWTLGSWEAASSGELSCLLRGTYPQAKGVQPQDDFKKRRDLLLRLTSEHPSPEEALLYATCEGDAVRVQSILQLASNSEDRSYIPMEVLDLDRVQDSKSAILEAVRIGNTRIVKMLLQHGANINAIVAHETTLSIAAKSGSESLLRLLLQFGGDSHVAVLMLRLEKSKITGASAINRLTTAASRYRDDVLRGSQKAKMEAICLRRAFFKEHANMIRAAASGSSFTLWCRTWGDVIEKQPDQAWSIGISTLRGLCNRVLPYDLNAVLQCLGIAKCMSGVVDCDDTLDSRAAFREDLGRWQWLFSQEDGGQLAYAEAVREIWGVDVANLERKPLSHVQVLEAFQHMTLNLVSTGGKHRYSLIDSGLLSTQTHWRQRMLEPSMKSEMPECQSVSGSCNRSEGESSQPNPTGSSGEKGSERNSHDDVLNGRKVNDHPLTRYDMILVILMAGAIFAAVMAFLLMLGNSLRATTRSGAVGLPRTLDMVQAHSLKTAVGMFVQVARENGSAMVTKQKPDLLDDIGQDVNMAIDSGEVTSLRSLRDFLAGHSRTQPTKFRNALLATYDQLKEINIIQHSYSVFQEYFGLKLCNSAMMKAVRAQASQDTEDQDPNLKRSASPGTLTSQAQKRLRTSSSEEQSSSPSESPSTSMGTTSVSSGSPSKSSRGDKKTYCDECQHDFGTTSNYGKHRRGPRHDNKRYECSFRCGKSYLRNETRRRHEANVHRGILASEPQLPGRNVVG